VRLKVLASNTHAMQANIYAVLVAYVLLRLACTNTGIIKQQHIGGGVKANALIVSDCSKPNNCHDDCPFIIALN
jgi:hypothetical protein